MKSFNLLHIETNNTFSLEDYNYIVFITLLENEFVFISFIIIEMYKQLLDKHNYNPDFVNMKRYLSEIKADFSELKSSYSLKLFFKEDIPGVGIVGRIHF